VVVAEDVRVSGLRLRLGRHKIRGLRREGHEPPITVGLDNVRLAGTLPGPEVVFAATAADVRHVVVSGREVVRDGRHLLLGDVASQLASAVHALLD